MLGPEFQNRFESASTPSYTLFTKRLDILSVFDRITRRDPILAAQLLTDSVLKYGTPHMRWETVRHSRGALVTGDTVKDANSGQILRHTGWEGYYVDSGMDPEDIIEEQADIGARVVNGIEAIYPQTYEAIKKLLNAGRGYSIDTLREIDICFKSIKARFEGKEYSPEFRRQTEEIVKRMPPAVLERDSQGITHTLPIPNQTGIVIPATTVALTSRQLAGYNFMAKIGLAGQPLIRTMLEVA